MTTEMARGQIGYLLRPAHKRAIWEESAQCAAAAAMILA